MLQLQRLCQMEELGVLGVGPGPAPLDEVDAQFVQLPGNLEFVLDGERNALLLRAVPQRGVVQFHFGHDSQLP